MNKVDLLFVIDITGSMGHLIEEAKEKMQTILEQLSKENDVDLRVGFSLYRDHPSQGDEFVTAVWDLEEVGKTKERISLITVWGGGDTKEATLDGLVELKKISWRKNSRRISFLIGDAPVKGMGSEGCCSCGLSWGDAISTLESKGIVLYSIPLGSDSITSEDFKKLAVFTGGRLLQTEDAMGAIFNTLKMELKDYLIKRE